MVMFLMALILYRKNLCDSPSQDSCKTESLALDRVLGIVGYAKLWGR